MTCADYLLRPADQAATATSRQDGTTVTSKPFATSRARMTQGRVKRSGRTVVPPPGSALYRQIVADPDAGDTVQPRDRHGAPPAASRARQRGKRIVHGAEHNAAARETAALLSGDSITTRDVDSELKHEQYRQLMAARGVTAPVSKIAAGHPSAAAAAPAAAGAAGATPAPPRPAGAVPAIGAVPAAVPPPPGPPGPAGVIPPPPPGGPGVIPARPGRAPAGSLGALMQGIFAQGVPKLKTADAGPAVAAPDVDVDPVMAAAAAHGQKLFAAIHAGTKGLKARAPTKSAFELEQERLATLRAQPTLKKTGVDPNARDAARKAAAVQRAVDAQAAEAREAADARARLEAADEKEALVLANAGAATESLANELAVALTGRGKDNQVTIPQLKAFTTDQKLQVKLSPGAKAFVKIDYMRAIAKHMPETARALLASVRLDPGLLRGRYAGANLLRDTVASTAGRGLVDDMRALTARMPQAVDEIFRAIGVDPRTGRAYAKGRGRGNRLTTGRR